MTTNSNDYNEQWRQLHPECEMDYVKGGHRVYANIKQRCNNPKHFLYPHYGERGIHCEITKEEFLELYFRTDTCEICHRVLNDENRWSADGRTVDRADVNRSYQKDNIRIICRSCNAGRSRSKAKKTKV